VGGGGDPRLGSPSVRRLHARVRRLARERGVSLNEYCRNAIERCAEGAAPTGPIGDPESPWVAWARRVVGDRLEGIVLFGSQARGEARENSDVDLLVVVAKDVELSRELYRQWDLLGMDRRVSPHFVHEPESVQDAGSVWYETALDGVIVYERDRSVTQFLQAVRRAIAAGRLRRRSAHGHPYWVKETEPVNAG